MKRKRVLALTLALLLAASLTAPSALASGLISGLTGGGTDQGGTITVIDGGNAQQPQPAPQQQAAPAAQQTAPTIQAVAPAATPEPTEVPIRETIHIKTVDDLRSLVASCALDSYSIGLEVVLDNDLDLAGASGISIPIFSGRFEGGGHTVSGLMLTGGSNLGFFRYVQESAEIRNLQLKGSVVGDETSDKVGSLAGTSHGLIENCGFEGSVSGRNYVGGLVGQSSGSILNCRCDAQVQGKRFTGGVVGYSTGIVRNCENYGPVNTVVTEAMLSLDDLANVTTNSLDLLNAEDESVVSDSGGIAGYSSGILLDCVNHGAVGYQHFGYNLGGIAGRQSGFLSGCENYGAVLGRKDVAGIVGQMEPYLDLISEQSLSDEVLKLNQYLNAASGDLAVMGAQMGELADDADADRSSFLDDMNNSGSISGADVGSIADGDFGSISGGLSGGGNAGGSISGDNGITYHSGSNASDEYAGLADRLSEAYDVLSGTASVLSQDLGSANDQFAKVLLMMSNALNGETDHQVFDDISEQLGQEDTEGRVSQNRNHGRVEGDSNIGGVIGAMGIEYEFDIEDKLVENIGANGIVNKIYETKCISSDNVNYGSVTGRKDRVGGVVGSSETGIVTGCEGYGSVESSDGGYVGGVAGYSSTSIRDSYAKCSVSGGKYVGGVAGYGSTITDCATLVDLSSSNVCAGAIAGWADMSVEDAVDRNIYVHESLGAVDGISYTDKAAPVSYDELVSRENVPTEFKYVTVSFMADGELVKNVRLPYGGSITESQIPAVPEKAGYAGSWQSFETKELRFNTTVEAEYILHQGTIAVEETRENSPLSILLVEADFQERIVMELKPYEAAMPEQLRAIEAWEMTLDGYTNPDGLGYTVRFLMPESRDGGTLEIYRLRDGEWVREELGRSGSYVTFRAEDDHVIFAVSEQENVTRKMIPWFIAGAVAVILIVALAVVIARSRKRRKSSLPEAEQNPKLPPQGMKPQE